MLFSLVFVIISACSGAHLSIRSSFISVIFIQPSDTSGYFYLKVDLVNDDGSWLYISGVPCTIYMYTESAMTGTITRNSTPTGDWEFKDLRSVYRGYWYVYAYSAGYTTAYSPWFTISTGNTAFSSVVVSTSNTSPGMHLSFAITTTAYDSNGDVMLNPCTMTLSEDYGYAIQGTTSSYITGSASFSIYFNSAASMIIRGTCLSAAGTVGVVVYQNNLQITSFSAVFFM